MKLRVEPEGTPSLEAEAHHVFTQQAPWEGCSVAVIHDPSKPSDLVVDESQGFAASNRPAFVPYHPVL